MQKKDEGEINVDDYKRTEEGKTVERLANQVGLTISKVEKID